LCRLLVEDEWSEITRGRSLSINGGPMWFMSSESDRGTIWDRAGQLGRSGECNMGTVRVICFHVRSSEGGSPHLCHLRTMSAEPWGTSIDYVLVHMGFMGSHKFSSFDGHRVVRYPILPTGCTLGWCVGHPWMPIEVLRGRHALGWGRTRFDSSIVILNCCHLWCLREPRVSCCQVLPLQDVYWFKSPRHSQIWVRLNCCVQT
jgi:hypothetical protein